MGTGEGRENGGRQRRSLDGDDDDDEEYVVEEEDYAEFSASSAGEEGEDSDAEYEEDEDEDEEVEYAVETPRPKRPVKGGDRGRKGKAYPAAAQESDAEYEEDEDEEEEVEYAVETPRPKRPVKGGDRGRKGKTDPAAARDSDAEYEEDEHEEEEVEYAVETPRPKRPVKGGDRGRKGKTDPAAARDSDAEYEEDEDEEEEVEYAVETPRPKRPVKGGDRGRKGKTDPDAARSRRRRYEEDDDYEEELDEDEDVEEDHDELEEVEAASRRPKSLEKYCCRGQNMELSPVVERSLPRRHEGDDLDFDPDLDDEDEMDEDIDFDPEVDDEGEFEDEEEEEEKLGATRARKVTVKNPVKRKSVSKRRSQNKKKSSGSKVSRRKVGSAKARKPAPVRRRRKRSVIDHYEEDDDFIVEDQIMENRHPRKKARTMTGRKTEMGPPVSVIEEETWPTVDSDTSDFEFVTSDEEPDNVEMPVVETTNVRKGRKKRISGSESSSDSEFIVSDKELESLKETEPPPKVLPLLPAQMRRISVTRNGEDKGKKKEEPEEVGKPICGICLSEEQRATVQGVLNCCSHYFCFACIMEWSRVESRCPLCKQRFTTITKSSKIDLGLGQRKAVIRIEERDQVYQPSEEEIRRWLDPYENVVCIECNQGGDDSLMLLCDICDSSAHTYCVGLGREVPEGNWYCGGCRLSDEGPSYTRIQHTVGYGRQNYRSHVDGGSIGFGTAAPNGTFERPPSINSRRTFQGIDLNLSPREAPGEIHPVESQGSTDSVSTPSGRRATVSGRRQIHRYIRILLSTPRPTRTEVHNNNIERSGAVPRIGSSRHNFRSSSEANTSQILPDGIQNQHNDLPLVQAHNSNFAPCMSIDGNDFQQIEGARSNLKHMCSRSPR
ncbi:uncharacterized protein LOC133916272 [Phragmites australis]|uniref:uncharacterized protein LOC133916272 n=1 Tax=Phragmites australis TaxID=29695 RepID=UPI002D77000C|nr:uncharacterized protein LOC133916272 [Phragmites australis]